MVERIDPNGALLMIKHKPLVPLPGLSDGELPVKISGVKVSGLGLNWLQAIVAGNEVKFIPIAKAQNFVQCKVLLPQTRNVSFQIVLHNSLILIFRTRCKLSMLENLLFELGLVMWRLLIKLYSTILLSKLITKVYERHKIML